MSKHLLFDEKRHEKVRDIPWSEALALETVNKIFDETLASYDAENLWDTPSDEAGTASSLKSLYDGTSGILWGLIQVSKKLEKDLPFDPVSLIDLIEKSYLQDPDSREVIPSYFVGHVGILLIKYSIKKDENTKAKLFELVEQNITNPANEAFIGCAGTILAPLFFAEQEDGFDWKNLFRKNANYLFNEWHQNEEGLWVWAQDLYGQMRQFIGAAHGFFGNVFPLLKGIEYLSPEQAKQLLSRTLETTIRSAKIEGDLVNWPTKFTEDGAKMLVQWCHGAPSAVMCLDPFPRDYSEELESFLIKAGELIWEAGPLKKGVGICHGTDGNGYAFLKLYKRTGDTKWLDRARTFAMHAIEQRGERHALWVGNIGLALYLISCLEEDGRFPSLDYL